MQAWYDYTGEQNVKLVKEMRITGRAGTATLEDCIDSYYGKGNSRWRAYQSDKVMVKATFSGDEPFGDDYKSVDMTIQINHKAQTGDFVKMVVDGLVPTVEEFNMLIDEWVRSAV